MGGIAIAHDGTIYVYDNAATKIRKITPGGIVSDYAGSTLGDADGPAQTAKFSYIEGIAIGNDGTLYVTDVINMKVKKIAPNGIVTTVAGSVAGYQDGIGTNAEFLYPYGIVVTANNILYVADLQNDRIRMITPGGVVTTVAGSDNPHGQQPHLDGQGTAARFVYTLDLALYQNALYITEAGLIAKVTLP